MEKQILRDRVAKVVVTTTTDTVEVSGVKTVTVITETKDAAHYIADISDKIASHESEIAALKNQKQVQIENFDSEIERHQEAIATLSQDVESARIEFDLVADISVPPVDINP